MVLPATDQIQFLTRSPQQAEEGAALLAVEQVHRAALVVALVMTQHLPQPLAHRVKVMLVVLARGVALTHLLAVVAARVLRVRQVQQVATASLLVQ